MHDQLHDDEGEGRHEEDEQIETVLLHLSTEQQASLASSRCGSDGVEKGVPFAMNYDNA